ncbi:MAG: hypothetical protein WBE92_04680 [Steroidobacteraceae bacterium]
MAHRTVLAIAGAALSFLGASAAHATDWDFSLDTRLVASDGERSFLDDGLGTLRYGESKSGIQLGRARIALTQSIGNILALHLDASSWGDHDKIPAGLTEAYFELRPYPIDGFRARVRAGAFYAPISLENRASGWESPYTLSYSAIDSWIGEELRTIGVDTEVDWLGTQLGHTFDVGVVGGAFGWNEPAGAELASHGFAIDDRQTVLFGRVGEPGPFPGEGLDEFHEFDGHVGTYVGLNGQYLDRVFVQALHYDNHADPAAFDAALNESAWETDFNSAGTRVEFPGGWTAIAQWLEGETYLEPAGVGELEWDFRARYVLLSKQFGQQTLSARYDAFEVDSDPPNDFGVQNGHALTLAYLYEPNEHWRFALEAVRVRSAESNRTILLGATTPFATESMLQLSVRYAIRGN